VLVPGLVLGALFPLAARLTPRIAGGVGARVGRIYAWNTAGAIAGAMAAGFLLVQTLGSERTLVLASAASALVALTTLIFAPPGPFRAGAGTAPAARRSASSGRRARSPPTPGRASSRSQASAPAGTPRPSRRRSPRRCSRRRSGRPAPPRRPRCAASGARPAERALRAPGPGPER